MFNLWVGSNITRMRVPLHRTSFFIKFFYLNSRYDRGNTSDIQLYSKMINFYYTLSRIHKAAQKMILMANYIFIVNRRV